MEQARPQPEVKRSGDAAVADAGPPGAASALASPLLRLYPALQVPTFRLLWLSMLPATLAWQISQVATGYAAFTLSHSATTLGWVSLANGIPLLVFALVGGVAADRLPRRLVLLATQALFAVATGIVMALALLDRLAVWHLVAFGLAQGVAMSFNVPARQAYIAELVPARWLRGAVALNNAGMNCCRIVGPALAGVLLALPAVGVGGVFLLMTGMYGVVLLSLTRLPRGTAGAGARQSGGLAQLVEGLRYIVASPALRALLGLAFVPLFFGMAYQTLMPVFAERVFEVGATGLGILMAAAGLGALAGSVTIAALAGHPRPAVLQLALGVGFGLTLVGFALSPVFPLAVAFLVGVGFCSAAYAALNNALIMGNTEPRLYGRVMSVYLLTYAVVPLGSFPAAWLADHIGSRLTIAGGGAILALVVIAVATLFPAYRKIR